MTPRFLVVVLVACAHSEGPEYWAILPDGRTTKVEAVAPEWARSPTTLTSQPTSVCSGPGECRDVIGMRPCRAPGTMICFDVDQTKCFECKDEKFVLRLR